MGREVRMVPPNWAHPDREYSDGRGYQPMYNRTIETAFVEWLADFDRVRAGDLKDYERDCYTSTPPLLDWLNDNTAPDPVYYRPWQDAEATWFQVWETVSEGTPVTPPFATKAELVDYLVEHGDFWQQKCWKEGDRFMQPEKPGYSRKAAESFVGTGWAPSMVVIDNGQNTQVFDGINAASALKGSP